MFADKLTISLPNLLPIILIQVKNDTKAEQFVLKGMELGIFGCITCCNISLRFGPLLNHYPTMVNLVKIIVTLFSKIAKNYAKRMVSFSYKVVNFVKYFVSFMKKGSFA